MSRGMKVLKDCITTIFLISALAFSAEKCSAALIDKQINAIFPAKCWMLITSGYRNVKHNKRVGGAPNSYHVVDRARDIQTSVKCRKLLLKRLNSSKLTVIRYKSHLHIDNRRVKKCLIRTISGFVNCASQQNNGKIKVRRK